LLVLDEVAQAFSFTEVSVHFAEQIVERMGIGVPRHRREFVTEQMTRRGKSGALSRKR